MLFPSILEQCPTKMRRNMGKYRAVFLKAHDQGVHAVQETRRFALVSVTDGENHVLFPEFSGSTTWLDV